MLIIKPSLDRSTILPILDLFVGTTFRRVETKYNEFVYMRVNICSGMRWESKDTKRQVTIVNLNTGTVFCVAADEEVVPLYNSAVVEDTTKQRITHV